MESRIYEFQIRALISREEREWVAHALEMDLVAYGKTETEAMKVLENLVLCQISFAIAKGEDHLMYFRAPDEFFQRWEKAHAAALKGLVTPGACKKLHVKANSICFTQRKIEAIKKASYKQRFEQSHLVGAQA